QRRRFENVSRDTLHNSVNQGGLNLRRFQKWKTAGVHFKVQLKTTILVKFCSQHMCHNYQALKVGLGLREDLFGIGNPRTKIKIRTCEPRTGLTTSYVSLCFLKQNLG